MIGQAVCAIVTESFICNSFVAVAVALWRNLFPWQHAVEALLQSSVCPFQWLEYNSVTQCITGYKDAHP